MNTYFLFSPYIDENILLRRGNWKQYSESKKIDFLFIERASDNNTDPTKGTLNDILSRFYGKKIGIENYIESEGVDKYSFIESFLRKEKEKKFVQIKLV